MVNKDTYSHHISQQFNEELDEVKKQLLEMGGQVENQINDAMEALVEANSELAETVMSNDDHINRMEVSIDEDCARILARRQPAASDLRLVIAVSKANNDLERIGDETKRNRQAGAANY